MVDKLGSFGNAPAIGKAVRTVIRQVNRGPNLSRCCKCGSLHLVLNQPSQTNARAVFYYSVPNGSTRFQTREMRESAQRAGGRIITGSAARNAARP